MVKTVKFNEDFNINFSFPNRMEQLPTRTELESELGNLREDYSAANNELSILRPKRPQLESEMIRTFSGRCYSYLKGCKIFSCLIKHLFKKAFKLDQELLELNKEYRTIYQHCAHLDKMIMNINKKLLSGNYAQPGENTSTSEATSSIATAAKL